jgi:hypothetical protein
MATRTLVARVAVRILLATLVLASVASGALWLHGYKHAVRYACRAGQGPYTGALDLLAPATCVARHRASWADPLALGGLIAGVGISTTLVVGHRR